MPPRRTPAATAELRTSLIEHAQRLIRREGPAALTMRALAAEANCAVGLPYTVFPNRQALVAALVGIELARLTEQLNEWIRTAGSRSVGDNLGRFASVLLDADAPSLRLAESIADSSLNASITASAEETGLLRSFDTAVADYLAAEQQLGRVEPGVDVTAFGFLITGAIHNLLAAGDGYPRPDRRRLRKHLVAVADRIAKR